MRRLLMLRHAKSARPEGVDDHERPLSGRGRRDSEDMGHFMVARGLVPDAALVSTSVRTRTTWELISRAFGQQIAEQFDAQLYLANPTTMLGRVQNSPAEANSLVIVSHQPGLGQLAEKLIGIGHEDAMRRLSGKFPTAALAVICFAVADWQEVCFGKGKLLGFYAPSNLARVHRKGMTASCTFQLYHSAT